MNSVFILLSMILGMVSSIVLFNNSSTFQLKVFVVIVAFGFSTFLTFAQGYLDDLDDEIFKRRL